jgi:hypothetical protein
MSEVINAFLTGQQYRNQLNQQQQQAQSMQEQRGMQNTAAKVQGALMQGDQDLARSIAAGSGSADIMGAFRDQMASMDTQERTRQQEIFGAVGNLANSLRGVPVDQRSIALRSEAPRLMQMGVPAEEIQRYDQLLSDPASSDAVLAALSSRVTDAQAVYDAYAPQMQAENEVLASYQGGRLTQGPINPNAPANRAIAQQGADARMLTAQTSAAQESRQAAAPQQEWVTLTAEQAQAQGFAPGDVVQENMRTGQIARRSSEPRERTFNQAQSQSAGFANRMAEANRNVDRLAQEGFTGSEFTQGDIPVAGRLIRGSNERQYDQAASNFITALLRQESGAAIGQDEFDTAYRTYFPERNDDPATIEQKRQLRQMAIDNMVASSQGAFDAYFGMQPDPVDLSGVSIEDLERVAAQGG